MTVQPAAFRPPQRHPAREAGIAAMIAVVLPLLVPLGMIVVLGGNAGRLAVPFYLTAAAIGLLFYRRPLYPAFVIAVFAYVAFLRRVADNSGGFVSFNPILIAPYVALLPTLPALLRRVLGHVAGPVWPFVVLVLCIVYGFLLALVEEAALVSAVYEPARWLLPIALCAFIMDDAQDHAAIRRALINALMIVLPVLAIYAVYQYVVAPPWDVFWMLNIDNPTFGFAEPFKIRVFSMMNSPFSAAAFATMVMILLAGEGAAGLAIAALGIPLVALTLVRTGWVGLVVGLLGLLATAPPSRKLLLVAGPLGLVVVCMMAMASPLVSPEVARSLTGRLATFQELQDDGSAQVRLNLYDNFYERLDDHPLGAGFGVNQSIVTLQGKKANEPLDSGVLEAYLVLGVVAGTAYFMAIGGLVAEAFRVTRQHPVQLTGCMAVIWSVLLMSFLGSAQIGEVGALQWAALGIILCYGDAGAPVPSVRPNVPEASRLFPSP